MSAAKELLLLLVGVDQSDRKRMKLVALLFPLLPVKYRYQIEKLGLRYCLEASSFWRKCNASLSGQDMDTILRTAPQMLIDQRSSLSSVVDANAYTRTLLEDLQKILTIIHRNNIPPTHFLSLLPEHHLGKAQAVNNELTKERDCSKAKERSLQNKGEKCVNGALFQRSQPRSFVPTDQPEESDSQQMADALAQAKTINCQRKERIMAMQYNSRENIKAKRPLSAATMKDAQSKLKRVCNPAPSSREENDNILDRVLNKVKSDVYQPRLERRIKANVPENFICSLCNTRPEEVNVVCVYLNNYGAILKLFRLSLLQPLVALCGHSACTKCWKVWLGRQNTCPHCRKHVEIKTLAKMIFKDTNGNEGFTQMCESDSDEIDELEIVAS